MRRALVVFFVAACGATQTDPPPRPIGVPGRDAGPGGDGSADDASDDGNTTVVIGDDSGTDAGPDARVDAPECTTSATIAAPAAPVAGLTLAAYSLFGFSGTQGKCGWSYGYVAPATSTAFVAMGEYDATGEAWYVQNTVYWTFLNRLTSHPNGVTTSGGRMSVDHWAVRRWTSNHVGPLRITGTVKKSSGTAGGGNGIVARIVVAGNKIYDEIITDEAGKTFDLLTNVALDATVDFVVDPFAGNDGADSTDFTAALWK